MGTPIYLLTVYGVVLYKGRLQFCNTYGPQHIKSFLSGPLPEEYSTLLLEQVPQEGSQRGHASLACHREAAQKGLSLEDFLDLAREEGR